MAKKTRKSDDASQHARFVEAARELGADENEEHFNEALRKIGRHKQEEEKSERKQKNGRDGEPQA